MAKRVLIVDDYEASRTMLAQLVRALGYETIEAVSGIEALEKALADEPDLILMDLALPGMTGVDASKALKENPTTAHIPIIAYSAGNARQGRERALGAGMVDYLAKPASVSLIRETIEKYILS